MDGLSESDATPTIWPPPTVVGLLPKPLETPNPWNPPCCGCCGFACPDCWPCPCCPGGGAKPPNPLAPFVAPAPGPNPPGCCGCPKPPGCCCWFCVCDPNGFWPICAPLDLLPKSG